ncbi:MAG: site-2 protease family protein [Isosphaeraceae bacterium]
MFGANETPYDLRFRLLGIPVRVHPFFWVMSGMLGWEPQNLPLVALWIACVFVSILVHEFGHALAARAFGASPSVVLYGFGGLCMYQNVRQTARQRSAVLIWGPGAGFVLCSLVLLFYSVRYGLTFHEHFEFARKMLWMDYDHPVFLDAARKMVSHRDALDDRHVFQAMMPFFIYSFLVWINLCWGLINLLPVWPLDGGQLTQTVLSEVNPYNGRRWTHTVSLVCAGLVAIFIYTKSESLFNTFLFAYLFLINYQMLDAIHRAQVMGVYDEDMWPR